jgi:hypothetical protein
MADIKTPKGKKPFNSIFKSNIALPSIYKTFATNDTSRNHNKSSYLETIGHLANNVDYETKNTIYVNS